MLTVSQLDESQGSGRGHVHVIDSHTGLRLQQIELIEPIKEVPVDFTSLNHSYVIFCYFEHHPALCFTLQNYFNRSEETFEHDGELQLYRF